MTPWYTSIVLPQQIKVKTAVRGKNGQLSFVDDHDESPLKRYRKLATSVDFFGLSDPMKQHVRTIANATRLPREIAEILDREFAPLFVCRWVARGAYLQDRVLRLALVLMMRKEARSDKPAHSISGWAWAPDRYYTTAERKFWQTPQATRLIKADVLASPGTVPRDGGPKFTTLWAQTWAIFEREFATIDCDAFMREVHVAVSQRKRRRVRKHRKLTAEQRAYISQLDAIQRGVAVIKRGVLRGDITVDEALAIHRQQQEAAAEATTSRTPAPTERKRKG